MSDQEADAWVQAVATDWRSAELSPPDRALCEFAVKLTHRQREMAQPDIEVLRNQGFDDRAIHDATQVTAYFNYITRIADALGIDPEPGVKSWA